MDDFEIELKSGFLEEASQLLTEVESCFLNLESNPDDASLIDRIFRLAHNLKGSAKAVGFEDMGAFAHVFESFLLKVKNGEVKKSSPVISLLLRCNDFLNVSVETLKGDMSAKIDPGSLLTEIQDASQGKLNSQQPEQPSPQEQAEPNAEEVAQLMALETEKQIEAAIVQETAEAPLPGQIEANSEKPMESVSVEPPSIASAPIETKADTAKTEAKRNAPASAADESIRVSLSRVDKLLNYVGELVILETVLKEQAQGNSSLLLKRSVHQIGKVTKEIQDLSMGLRMIPVKQTFQKMQRIVRDTASLLNKKVTLVLEGEETELDKTVLENIGDPLVHLVRNAVDHGIENPEDRIKAGKNPEGTLTLRAYHQGGKLIIEVKDDGGGINTEVLKRKAVEKKILPPGKELSHQEAVNLIFHPGFSTKQVVTEVSGRGVGMDVVKTNIESLQGEIQIETQLGSGTCFKVLLPLTLAIIDGMVVKCGEERFVIPLAQVHESVQPSEKDLQINTGQHETFILRREPMPLIRLSHALGRKYHRPATKSIAIVIRTGQRPFALLVDDIIGQHQIVVKKLGPELQGIKAFSGSAVLGDGRPALILEPAEIAAHAKPIPKFEMEKMEALSA